MLIEIEKIKIKDRIRKDFGNIQELADDIKENGLINPPVITPDTYELITGERRIRAMKLLGYEQIEVRPMAVKDAEHQLNLEISENEARKDFSKAERIDYARKLERIESLKAKERQATSTGGVNPQLRQISDKVENKRTDEIVSEKLGIGSRDTYRKEKYIVDNQNSLTPKDFSEWDEGKLSTNKVFNKIKIEKEKLEKENKILESQKKISDELAAQYKLQSEEYMEVKKKLTHMGLEPDGDYNTFQATVQITELNNELSELLQNRLAPIKYQSYMFAVKSNEILKKNFLNTLSMLNDWYLTMLSYIGEESNEENIIDIETEDI